MVAQANTPSTVNVLVTRPNHQADGLCGKLTASGLHAIRYPSIEIQPVDDTLQASNALRSINDGGNIIFISANAVTQANRLLNGQWPAINGPNIAIGPSTANALLNIGLTHSIIAQKPFSSEQLLEQLASTGKTCIIKGEGGRKFLENELTSRGINVRTIDVYKRATPRNPKQPNVPLHYITITSQLALSNLFLLLAEQADELKRTSTFVVFSQRIADYAKKLGCKAILISKEASDASLVSCISQAEKCSTF